MALRNLITNLRGNINSLLGRNEGQTENTPPSNNGDQRSAWGLEGGKADQDDGVCSVLLSPPSISKPSPEEEQSLSSIELPLESEFINHQKIKRRRVFLATAILSGLFIMTSGFFLFPRSTSFSMVDLDIDADNSTFFDGDQMMTNWRSTIDFTNNNFYPISVREVKIKAFLYRDRSEPVGYGHGANLYLKSRSTTKAQIQFAMPVYAPSTGRPNIIAECMQHDQLSLFLDTSIDLAVTHWTGRWISVPVTTVINCAIPGVSGFISALNNSKGKGEIK